MYLTKFEINRARRGARQLLGSPQAMHAVVMSAFPSGSAGRPLWRVDSYPDSAALFILSATPPDLTHAVEQAGWPTTQAWQTRDYATVLESVRARQTFRFRLTANPTRSVKLKEGKRSQRVGHVTAAQQQAWLLERATRLGVWLGDAAAPSFGIVERGTKVFRRRGGRVTIAVATFEGVLRVEEPDVLRQAIMAGVGPAKAYGCGLLTLAPSEATPG